MFRKDFYEISKNYLTLSHDANCIINIYIYIYIKFVFACSEPALIFPVDIF